MNPLKKLKKKQKTQGTKIEFIKNATLVAQGINGLS